MTSERVSRQHAILQASNGDIVAVDMVALIERVDEALRGPGGVGEDKAASPSYGLDMMLCLASALDKFNNIEFCLFMMAPFARSNDCKDCSVNEGFFKTNGRMYGRRGETSEDETWEHYKAELGKKTGQRIGGRFVSQGRLTASEPQGGFAVFVPIIRRTIDTMVADTMANILGQGTPIPARQHRSRV